ncbi:MAG: acyl-CoA thioesterase [Acidobacteriota bacterium]|nr:acyl-CoA thioesterase [Acidobacteriota bacterium]
MLTRRGRGCVSPAPPDAPPPLRGRALRAVRFQEVDPMGVVWHGRYPEFLEDGRVEVGRAHGLDYSDFYREGLKAPIVRLEIEYRSPLVLGDTMSIDTDMVWTEAVRLDHVYVIRRQSDNRLVATARTVQLLLDKDDALCLLWPDYFLRLRREWRLGRLGGRHD